MTTGDHQPSDSTVPAVGGLVLAPFRALRYAGAAAEALSDLLSPPYDVISEEQHTALERSNPHNAVRLILPRADAGDPESGYRRAADTLRDWRATGVLDRDADPAIYVYEMASAVATTRGLIGALALVDPLAGIVLPHENTMPGPVADRLALTQSTEANLEPIYLVYDGGPVAAEVVAGVDRQSPLLLARTADGIEHRLWAVTDPATLQALAAELLPQHALIADGHHRYATYLAEQARRHDLGAGAGPWDFGLTYLVDAKRFGPHVEAIHRVLPTLPLSDALAKLGSDVEQVAIEPDPATALATMSQAGRTAPAFVLTDGQSWHLLRYIGAPAGDRALDRLDVTVAHRLLIDRAWGVDLDLVEYEHQLDQALSRARTTGGVVLLLNPTPVDQVATVAADGDRMPRKSTLFTPKPATGMLFRPYDESSSAG